MKLDVRKLGVGATLLVLAAGSWWLSQLTTEEVSVFDGKQRHDPDFIVEDFHSLVMTETGQPQYEIRAKRLLHYGDDDSSEVESPYFIQHVPGRASTHARAQRGFMPRAAPYIELTGDVHVAQGRDPKSAGGDIRVQTLTFILDRSR